MPGKIIKISSSPSPFIKQASLPPSPPLTLYQGEDHNSDFCLACGGAGHLILCDGCDGSYHFDCVDPPLTEDSPELQAPWFCNKCRAQNSEPQKHHGIFAVIIRAADARLTGSFSLPTDIATFFQGVKRGTQGEYVEGPGNLPAK